MPIYEYECESCHHRIEVMQKATDPPLKTCERCSGSLKRILSAPGLMFKGSGWYVTDYSNKLKSKEESKPADGDKKKPEAATPKAEAPAPPGSSAKKEPPSK